MSEKTASLRKTIQSGLVLLSLRTSNNLIADSSFNGLGSLGLSFGPFTNAIPLEASPNFLSQ